MICKAYIVIEKNSSHGKKSLKLSLVGVNNLLITLDKFCFELAECSLALALCALQEERLHELLDPWPDSFSSIFLRNWSLK